MKRLFGLGLALLLVGGRAEAAGNIRVLSPALCRGTGADWVEAAKRLVVNTLRQVPEYHSLEKRWVIPSRWNVDLGTIAYGVFNLGAHSAHNYLFSMRFNQQWYDGWFTARDHDDGNLHLFFGVNGPTGRYLRLYDNNENLVLSIDRIALGDSAQLIATEH